MKKRKKGFTILFVFILLAGALAAVMMYSPLLLLSDIQVGSQQAEVQVLARQQNESLHYTDEEIIRVSGIEKGKNAMQYLGGSVDHMIHLRMGKAETRVENLPWIKQAEIRYRFPGTVEIHVTEREAVAWIRHMSNFLLIDEEGYVMEVTSKLDEQYPEIRGIELSKFTLGEKIETEKPEKIGWLIQLLQSLEQVDSMNRNSGQKLMDVLNWVDFPSDKELYMSLDNRITAKIKLDDEVTYRLSYLKELYYNYIKPEEKGMVDFFDEKYARFIAE